jgi:hypothetical protein
MMKNIFPILFFGTYSHNFGTYFEEHNVDDCNMRDQGRYKIGRKREVGEEKERVLVVILDVLSCSWVAIFCTKACMCQSYVATCPSQLVARICINQSFWLSNGGLWLPILPNL